ncbi:hypothetical protein [Brevibacillus porteri]|uniref:Uncharacterized protein n=1 Tax=Brevibacillus porteri TaxID=2126350 RepID=A0ABX5FV02_9BACL|nr:hypothetical protein [Brevibacillus porteri]MED1797263.1 hypothetical protein [Brevibacillus porteri]MED2129333.1 hypothetical protein [Brevibacillus porteri]MED2743032.1 hypothetical protein [Brevibacillus porteri]MED2817815.1 hypothetical protein [Brevibacillus porteri]MED2896873.1 hypothetical protein [Brevibacillus porteri]
MSNEKLDILIEGMNELRLVAHALMDRQDELDAKMEALTMDVHQLKNDVAELKQDVAALKQDVAELKEGQDRHERILETLALRALEWNNFRRDFIRKSS